jgi:hypothetical protein
MPLKLIHSKKNSVNPDPNAKNLAKRNAGIVAVLLFFAIKLPMCFVTNNPEELRDYDHYVRMADGETAYRDFVWIYGPVSPLVYGVVLKIFPHHLITVRLFSFAVWLVGAFLVAQFLARYLATPLPIVLGTLFCTGIFGFPSYSHNHVLVAVAMIAAAYFFTRFAEDGKENDLIISFIAVMVCLFTRPVITGYGVFIGWMALLAFQKQYADRFRMLGVFAVATGILTLLFYLVFGLSLTNAFIPRTWAIVNPKPYPSLRNLIVHVNFWNRNSFVYMLKEIRGALETMAFYLHYFIWPTLVFTMASIYRFRGSLKAAAICCAFSLVGSLDLLHYGFESPMMEQAMLVRGQYFFALTAISIFLVAWPTVLRFRESKVHAALAGFGLLSMAAWSVYPWATGIVHLVAYPINPYHFQVLDGIAAHPDRSAVFEAAVFTNTLCRPTDYVVLPQYDPGIRNLLSCRDLFGKDAYAFTRMPWYTFAAGENPYAPAGGVTSEAMLKGRIESLNPRFYIVESASDFKIPCESPGWSFKDFRSGPSFRRVCWRHGA